MSAWLWERPSHASDSDVLRQAVTAMRAAAEMLTSPTGCEDVEISLHLAEVMSDLLNSVAEETLNITLDLVKVGGNVQHCGCDNEGEAS